MKKITKKTIYATVADEEGVNYREIAEMMSDIGFKMNHSSARNYVLRIMRKFADAITDEWGMEYSDVKKDKIARTPQFQQAICDILQTLEAHSNPRRESK